MVHQRDAGAGVFGETVRVRGGGLEEWVPGESPPPAAEGWDAALVFGGAMNVDQEDRHDWLRPEKVLLRELLHRGTPLLGVCLGSQLVAEAAGAQPRRAGRPEIGWHEVELTGEAADDPLIGEQPQRICAFQRHTYEIPLPPGALPLARSEVCLQAFRVRDRPAWGIQFHAEVTEETLGGWLDDYESDPDAVRIGIDPEAIRAETEHHIGGWNDVGRGICRRFLEVASG